MAGGLCAPPPRGDDDSREHESRAHRPVRAHTVRRHTMQTPQWQTPTAIDWRFGFEITLYVAAR